MLRLQRLLFDDFPPQVLPTLVQRIQLSLDIAQRFRCRVPAGFNLLLLLHHGRDLPGPSLKLEALLFQKPASMLEVSELLLCLSPCFLGMHGLDAAGLYRRQPGAQIVQLQAKPAAFGLVILRALPSCFQIFQSLSQSGLDPADGQLQRVHITKDTTVSFRLLLQPLKLAIGYLPLHMSRFDFLAPGQ